MARPRVLITGFGPFPGVPDNPSSWLAEALAEQAALDSGAEIQARVLPTEWQAAKLVPDCYASLQPTLMIHFGLSRRAKDLRVERFAHNRAALRADARGTLPPSTFVHAEGRARLDTKLPAAALAAHLVSCGFPAAASRSAGSYLCNYLYYHSLAWAERNCALALFVHIPPVNGRGFFGKAALLRAGQEILRFTLSTPQLHTPVPAMPSPPFAMAEAVPRAKDA